MRKHDSSKHANAVRKYAMITTTKQQYQQQNVNSKKKTMHANLGLRSTTITSILPKLQYFIKLGGQATNGHSLAVGLHRSVHNYLGAHRMYMYVHVQASPTRYEYSWWL